MKILILDTETVGLDILNDPTIEVAGLLLSTTTKEVLAEFSFLIKTDKPNAAIHINGISDRALQELPDSPLWLEGGLSWMRYLASQADVLLSHNAEFDAPRLRALGLTEDKPYICSRKDLQIPGSTSGKLSHIAVDVGVPVLKLHRAAADTRLLSQILCTVPDLTGFVKYALEPKTVVKALVSFNQKELAKAEGFFFDYDSKQWRKKLSLDEIKQWQNKPFAIAEV